MDMTPDFLEGRKIGEEETGSVRQGGYTENEYVRTETQTKSLLEVIVPMRSESVHVTLQDPCERHSWESVESQDGFSDCSCGRHCCALKSRHFYTLPRILLPSVESTLPSISPS